MKRFLDEIRPGMPWVDEQKRSDVSFDRIPGGIGKEFCRSGLRGREAGRPIENFAQYPRRLTHPLGDLYERIDGAFIDLALCKSSSNDP